MISQKLGPRFGDRLPIVAYVLGLSFSLGTSLDGSVPLGYTAHKWSVGPSDHTKSALLLL